MFYVANHAVCCVFINIKKLFHLLIGRFFPFAAGPANEIFLFEIAEEQLVSADFVFTIVRAGAEAVMAVPKSVCVLFECRKYGRTVPFFDVFLDGSECGMVIYLVCPVCNFCNRFFVIPNAVLFDIRGVIRQSFLELSFVNTALHHYRHGKQCYALVVVSDNVQVFGFVEIFFYAE